jgi:transcriptional regulator of heat shock response
VHQAISTGATQVEETRKQFTETEEQLRRELEDERRRLREQKEHLEAAQVYITGIEDMVKDTDAKALSKLLPLLISF